MRPNIGWLGSATLLIGGALAAVVWAGVVGRKPETASGPHTVSFTVTSVTLKLGNRDAVLPSDRAPEARTLVVRVGVWQPLTDPTLPNRRNLPLLIYAPGWGDAYDDNTVLMRTLASHGYGVVAIDDIARDPRAEWSTADDEAARLATFDVGTPDRQIQFMHDADRRVELAARKMRAVLEAIANTQASEPSFSRFDLDRVGAVGASFGGATAAEAALDGGNIRAAVNLDGLLFGRAATEAIPRPYLELNATLGSIPLSEIESTDLRRRFFARLNVQQIARQQRQLVARSDALNITIAGVRHSDFTDALYGRDRLLAWRPFRERPLRPSRVRAIVDDLVITFFDAHIRPTIEAEQRLKSIAHPEATIERGQGIQR
jgi:dienelactone hydrolase